MMIVVTATLLFFLLFFAPIRLRINVIAYPRNFSAIVQVRGSFIRIFNETLELSGRNLHCDGTVSTDVDLTKMDKQTGIDFLKCITIDKVCIALANNMLDISIPVVLVENVLSAIAMATLCNLSHCQLYMQVAGTFEQSHAHVAAVITTSVAELSFCLLRQEVKLWKTRISKKS